MNAINFPEANKNLGAPTGLDESQVKTIPAFFGQITGGNLDGLNMIVVAWKPSLREIEELKNGGSVFLTVIGGLPPHFISTSFKEAVSI